MIQIYFLSIILNVIAGYTLIADNDKNTPDSRAVFAVKDEKFRLIIGILAMAVGVLKILSAMDGDLRIIGDLLPAAAGIVSGFVMLYEYYRRQSTLVRDEYEKESVNQILVKNKKIIGFASILIAGLHFLFPKVLFL